MNVPADYCHLRFPSRRADQCHERDRAYSNHCLGAPNVPARHCHCNDWYRMMTDQYETTSARHHLEAARGVGVHGSSARSSLARGQPCSRSARARSTTSSRSARASDRNGPLRRRRAGGRCARRQARGVEGRRVLHRQQPDDAQSTRRRGTILV